MKASRIWQICLILSVMVVVAFVLRLPNLAQRPFHNDESVNALKFRTLWKTGEYKYDPNEYHGPILHYATLPFQKFSGQNIDEEKEDVLRFAPVTFGALSLLLLFLFKNALGRRGVFCVATLMAVSPSLVFYSRYYIHEIFFFTFLLLFLGALWKYSQTCKLRWIVTVGASIGLMHATKETFVFNIVAAGAGLFLLLSLEKFKGTGINFIKRIPLSHWCLGVLAAAIVNIILFSSFFTNASGPMDSFRTYIPWFTRAAGETPHNWPWYYYLKYYFFFTRDGGPFFTEAIILPFSMLGIWAGFKDHFNSPIRRLSIFLTGYTLILAAIYCVISYKTPWCFIAVIQGLILLAGLGFRYAMTTWKNKIVQTIVLVLLIGGSIHLVYQAHLLNDVYYEEPKNPHVYAHTISDAKRIVRTVDLLSQAMPKGKLPLTQVIAKNNDCWPLPWYLRKYENFTGYYATVPEQVIGDIIILSPEFTGKIKEIAGDQYQFAGFYGFRPKVFFQVAVKKELWKEYIRLGLAAKADDDDEGED